MSEEGKIDDIFRRKLANHSVAPGADVWSKIDSDLDNNGKKGFPFFRWTIFALLISGSIAGAYYGLNEGSAEAITITPKENQTEADVTSPETELSIENDSKESQTESIIEYIDPTAETGIAKNDKQQQTPKQNTQIASNKSTPSTLESSKSHGEINSTFVVDPGVVIATQNLIDQNEMNKSNQDQNISSSENEPKSTRTGFTTGLPFESESEEIGLEFMPAKIIAFEILNPELIKADFELANSSSNHNAWSVGAYYEANWNYKRINTKIGESASLDSLISSESNTFSSGFGVNVAYTTKKGLRISTGIEYAKWCRSADYPVSIPLSIQTGPGAFVDSYKGELLGATGGQNISIDNADLPLYENATLSPEQLNFEIDIHECYTAISIPIRIGYEFSMGSWDLVPEAGFTYNRIVDSELTGDSSYKLNSLKLNRENSYSENIFSLSGNLSLERHLSESFKISLVGSYKYWATPIYTNQAFETNPYIFSARVGVWYNFK